MEDFLLLFMLVAVYFLPYFLIFKFIKLSRGALGKIQSSIDSASNTAKNKGPIKSFRDKIDSDKKAIKDQKKRESFQKLNEGEFNGVVGRANKFRHQKRAGVTPILAMGKSAKTANERLGQQAIQRGLQESLEEENMENKTRGMQAEADLAKWRNNGALQTYGSGLLSDAANGVAYEFNPDGTKVTDAAGKAITRAATLSERRAGMKTIMDWGDAGAMQKVIDHFEGGSETNDKVMQEYYRQRGSGEFARAFVGKRPDWVKRNNEATDAAGNPEPRLQPGPAYDTFGAAELATYHTSGLEYKDASGHKTSGALVEYLDALKTSDVKKYDETISKLGAGIHQMIEDPETRSRASANSATMASYKKYLQTQLKEVADRTGSTSARAGYETLVTSVDDTGNVLYHPVTVSGGPSATPRIDNVSELQATIRAATAGSGSPASIPADKLGTLYTSTVAASDPTVSQAHIDIKDEITRRTSPAVISTIPPDQLKSLYTSAASNLSDTEMKNAAVNIRTEVVNRSASLSGVPVDQIKNMYEITEQDSSPAMQTAQVNITNEIVSRANNPVTIGSDQQLRSLYALTAKSQDPALQAAHGKLKTEVVSRASTGGTIKLSDVQDIVSRAIGPDGSRGPQYLSDDDLAMVLSGTDGSSDTMMQTYHKAAEAEYIRRGEQ